MDLFGQGDYTILYPTMIQPKGSPVCVFFVNSSGSVRKPQPPIENSKLPEMPPVGAGLSSTVSST